MADDPLQAALAEAESLMESLGTDDADDVNRGSFVIGDDDDDDEDYNEGEVSSQPHTVNTSTSTSSPAVHAHPLQQPQANPSTRSIGGSTSTSTSNMNMYGGGMNNNNNSNVMIQPSHYHPTNTTNPLLNSGGMVNHPAAAAAAAASAATFNTTSSSPHGMNPFPQHQQPHGRMNTVSSPPQQSLNDSSATAFLQSAGLHAANVDALRASTTRFASNLASMAQRGAAVITTPSSTAQTATTPFMMATNTHYAAASNTATTNGGATNNNSGMMMPPHSQQQPHQPQPELDADQKAALVQEHVGDLIPGERIIMFLSNITYLADTTTQQFTQQQGSAWCCVMTYYRLVWFNTVTNNNNNNNSSGTTTASLSSPPPLHWHTACWPPPPPNRLEMPLAAMDAVTKSVVQNGTLLCLTVTSKVSAYSIKFATAAPETTQRALEALLTYAFPGRRNLGYLFAFESKREDVLQSIQVDDATQKQIVTLEPWYRRFEGLQEYKRQFSANTTNSDATGGPWCIWTVANAQYQLCPSYPTVLAGPVTLDEAQHPDAITLVRQCAAFRSEHRLPVLTWSHGNKSGSIWRCAQPKVGLQGNRSTADELFLQHILQGARNARMQNTSAAQQQQQQLQQFSPSVVAQLTGAADPSPWMMSRSHQLKILDLRPRAAAMANRTAGYGYENTSHYTGCSLQFCNIGNIHAVRDAYQKLNAVCTQNMQQSDMSYTSAIEDTKWLSLIRLVWAAAWETAWWVHVHDLPVVVHCSHGWDRTSQVGALAQLLLDPYYRTIAGFACLVEKDFMAFGHPFHLRCGHGEQGSATAENEGQNSPIFLQFIDCVYQIVHLYPEAFEYNSAYLVALVDTIYACRFGNFLCDTEREREVAASVRQRTHSVWDYLETIDKYRNTDFVADETERSVLLCPLPTLLRQIGVWTDLHCRHAAKPTVRW